MWVLRVWRLDLVVHSPLFLTAQCISLSLSLSPTHPYTPTPTQEASRVNTPVMRPFFVEFPTESKAFAIEDAFLLGPALLVHPVVDEGVNSVSVYFPGKCVGVCVVCESVGCV